MAYITGVHAGNWTELRQHWWQLVLVSLALVSIFVGSTYISFLLLRKLWVHTRQKNGPSKHLHERVARHLQKYVASCSPESTLEKLDSKRPTSLGIYLGTFESPISDAQCKRLSERDMIILNPLQSYIPRVLAELSRREKVPRRVIGRLDLANVLTDAAPSRQSSKYVLSCLDRTMSMIITAFRNSEGGKNDFTGILLAGWEIFPIPVFHELCAVISTFGLEIYVETSAPDFLADGSALACSSISGLIIRNALVLPDGERRDCFDMEPLRTTAKSFVSQSCVRDFTVFVWETLDDDVVLPNAVLKRTFAWCNFYSVVSWIGSQSALMNATLDVVQMEPLSAFAWLKEPKVMELHDMWKSRKSIENTNHRHSVIGHLGAMLPSLEDAKNDCTCVHDEQPDDLSKEKSDFQENMEWFVLRDGISGDPLCTSAAGASYDGLGCFSVGLDVSSDDFQEVIFSQRNLRKLELLDSVTPADLREYGATFANFAAVTTLPSEPSTPGVPSVSRAIEIMAKKLMASPDDGSDGIRVFLGLHSGFQRTIEKQFWAVYHAYPNKATADIYISKTVNDVMGTLLHTFLSCRGLTRRECIAAETSFARWNKKLTSSHNIPPRLVQDVELLSPEECLHLLQRVSLAPNAKEDFILYGIKSAAMERLVDVPNWNQLKTVNTVGYLNGDISITELLESRLQWHCQAKRRHPNLPAAIALFHDVEAAIEEALRTRSHPKLKIIIEALEKLLNNIAYAAVGDLYALAVFCTMRRLAFDEVYVEVTDRNPLFNDQTDQSAAFAELFALGSRCESYFDCSPSQFGELLSAKYRAHYSLPENQPPMFKDTMTALPSAYAEAQIDVDPNYKPTEMASYKRFTFLSVFAIPALIDILMLTTTGHGLYLSGGKEGHEYMTHDEQHSATTALMISLLLSGAIGTWITCGGTFYLASMAFSAMNYFVVTRLLGGLAFTLVVAIVGFIAFACTVSVYNALLFFLYLMVLTTYLSLLAALANYQFIGSSFQSGRATIIFCIPILFVSPIVTMFVPNHDVAIYLTVLYVFVSMLFLGVRRTGAQWTTWYQKINLVDDKALRTWYIDNKTSPMDGIEKMSDPAILRFARDALLKDVLSERSKSILSKKTKDALVLKLVRSYEATSFLMNWYCQFTGVPQPIMFSSAWNVQTKVALFSMQKSQLGIRFHNGFLHWRQAGDEIGCTMLYFIVALLDKWISLLSGGDLIGLLPFGNVSLTMPVGFGLAYYLVGAVLLDFNANKLHELAAKSTEEVIPTDGDLAQALKQKSDNRRSVYWKTLGRFLLLHVWGLAVTSALLWLFASTESSEGTIIFLSYVLAYTGLLWYQYTKIFSGPHALKPLLIAVAIGLPLGFILNAYAPETFLYSNIVALGVACWTVAILSLWAGKIIGPPEDRIRPLTASDGVYNAYSNPGADHAWSQPEMQSLYEQLSDLSDKERLLVDPDSEFGSQVKLILEQCSDTDLSDVAKRAFPDADALLRLSIQMFRERFINVELMSVDHFSDPSMRAISSVEDDQIRLLVACETKRVSTNEDPLKGFYWDVAELLVQVTAERYLGLNTHDSLLARTLWLSNGIWNSVTGPDILERHLKIQTKNLAEIQIYLKTQILRDLCLGFDTNLDSENMPGDLRTYLINRCVGVIGQLTDHQIVMLNDKLNHTTGLSFDTYVARCNYAVVSGSRMLSRVNAWASQDRSVFSTRPSSFMPRQSYQRSIASSEAESAQQSQLLLETATPGSSIRVLDLLAHATPPKLSVWDHVHHYTGVVYHFAGKLCKFFMIAFVADPEFQRELRCSFPGNRNVANVITRFFLLSIWAWSKAIQRLFLPIFLFHNRKNVVSVWQNLHGMEVSIKRRRILIRNLEGTSTGFIHPVDADTFKLLQYKGDHKTEPTTNQSLISMNMYTNNMSLKRRVQMKNGNTVNDYIYDYRTTAYDGSSRRISKSDVLREPITRRGIAGENVLQDVTYNNKGLIDSGSYLLDGNMVRFKYHYQKASKYGGALLRAEFVLPHMSCTVAWCAPPRRKPEKLDTWLPHSQVTEATFVVGADVWESKYMYDHKFHPTILTTLNGQRVDTPDLILHDHLNVLKKPTNTSFLDDNPLYGFNSIKTTAVSRWLGLHTRRFPVSTSQSRSWLWKAWKDDPAFDGVIVRWLDERLLRRDEVLTPYWRKRDLAKLDAAEQYLDKNRDAIMASTDLDNTVSSWTPLAMKINDFYSFGQGGDACSRTRSNVTIENDDETALHVIAVDTGTWPNEGGGVSACRSDVINNLRTIKWHMVAESANDFGIPKRQIERNIHSLKVIPLWGLDLMTPTHGLFNNRLDSEVEHVTTHTTFLDIERNFVPILTALIRGARSLDFSLADIKQVTRALINLNAYFEDGRHWSAVWRSDAVKSAWRNLWLSQVADNALPSSQWFTTELPTLGQLDQGLELWSRYLFIYSIPIPEKMPAVFQASHHSVSASYGIVCKIKRGCTLQIWDHAISWRETNLYLSSSLCALSPFTRNSLLGLMRITSVLTLHHADTILPCADFFNPNWEVEIGTSQGKIENRSLFKRKIDPVVNGITNMERFAPVKEIKTQQPTVTMLSHLWFAKDIKTALLSADIIVNKWGFKDFQLEVYGAMDKTPSYTTDCQEIIATKSLRDNVGLKGEADPINVLERTWVFLNSSISEGLPLALGEAALTGAPVVCTDVGASLRVLTSPIDGACYSAVVAPNDAHDMARAQIKILALLDEFSIYEDKSKCSSETADSTFPHDPTPEDVARITRRMYEQADARRALGMRSRDIVMKSFSGERYLREHEQMLWVGKAKKDMSLPAHARPSARMVIPSAAADMDRVSMLSGRPAPGPSLHREGMGSKVSIYRTGDSSRRTSVPGLSFNQDSTMPPMSVSSGYGSGIGPESPVPFVIGNGVGRKERDGMSDWMQKPSGLVSVRPTLSRKTSMLAGSPLASEL
ncbi:related to glycosyl transferase [Rhynchosporium agropyri]|uniref:Related to glycosyl transferase n=1 Tax=Rhynchosporium agropyri TaxID=914238 RepID=A0A1E1L3W9_9HELO|nr:related to glycosyl transferase [Rhynchosporium agropyri]